MAVPDGELSDGLYEALVTEALSARIEQLADRRVAREKLQRAEAPNRIALHLARQIEQALEELPDAKRIEVGLQVAEAVLDRTGVLTKSDLGSARLAGTGEVLHAVMELQPDGTPRRIAEPLIPLLDTTLLTNAPGEPRVGHQLVAEIDSANDISVVMAFVRQTGIAPMLAALRRHTERGRRLRVLTTTYTGSTERRALDALRDAGADIKVSYDVSSTRLHAKAWLFERASGFSTAYVGSSNLTHSAQQSGLEWNVRLSGARNPDVISKVGAVFESYWEHHDFVPYDPEEFDRRTERASNTGPTVFLSPVLVAALPFQERLLELLDVSRQAGHHRNLLVSATGTGKTVMAALDYARLAARLGRSRLLFIAHRQEILDQSQATFRHVLSDAAFGEQWIAGKRPRHFEHVFASIQSLSRADLELLSPDHFDVVIIDEFHHAAAASYDAILRHLAPIELLGLTATPERADGLPVLHWFGDRIAAELRLWDAIDQQYLVPFEYYGVHDGLDLSDVPWTRGKGYDVDGLTKLYTANDVWAKQVVRQFLSHGGANGSAKALGFCVSVDHARFMARVFNDSKIAAAAVWGETPSDERASILHRLKSGALQVVFSVDLFNEGVDVPDVNLLLLLRPTESPTLFLQQLGRGLRRSPGKTACTVLDFVGTHRREFRFDRRLGALLRGTRKQLEAQVVAGFPFLPAGCHMELDPVAAEVVLRSIRSAMPSRWSEKVAELVRHVASGAPGTLEAFLDHSGLELADIYEGGRCWSDLCEAAGVPTLEAGPAEALLRKACGRVGHLDDGERLDFYAQLLVAPDPVSLLVDAKASRLTRMLVSQLVDQVSVDLLAKGADLETGVRLLFSHPQVVAELRQVLAVLRTRIDHVHHSLSTHPHVPLRVHARYTRLEILSAFGHGSGAKATLWQSGVFWLADEKADLFAFTLDKSSGHFSPTTRYRDYAISPTLIHWESQAATRAGSRTGERYQHHVEEGSSVILFARLQQDDRAFWCLGPATYVRHQGERPMAITWRLEHPLPGDLFVQFAAAAG